MARSSLDGLEDYARRAMRVLVVVPTYNERENVKILLPAVRQRRP